jgi:hypothetical protein
LLYLLNYFLQYTNRTTNKGYFWNKTLNKDEFSNFCLYLRLIFFEQAKMKNILSNQLVLQHKMCQKKLQEFTDTMSEKQKRKQSYAVTPSPSKRTRPPTIYMAVKD